MTDATQNDARAHDAQVNWHTKHAFAHDLVQTATFMLILAAKLRGDTPMNHVNAEFQALDLTMAEFNRVLVQYRTVLNPPTRSA